MKTNATIKSIIIVFFFLFSINIIAQKYDKTYRQNINYYVGNENGIDLRVRFACKYSALLGDPLFSSTARVVSRGDFVVYKGVKYTKEQIGAKVFNNITLIYVNVSFDIYQGSKKITTVRLRNEQPTSYGPSGYYWRNLWPGVSAERAKAIWKEGYSIRNAKLYDVKFQFWALDGYLSKKKREAEAKIRKQKLEAERKRKEAEAKKLEEERLEKEKKAKEEERLRKIKEAEVTSDERVEKVRKLAEAKDRARKERLKMEKELRDRQYELEKKAREKKSKEDAEYYQKRREAKKAMEEANKRKFEKSRRDLEKSVGNVFGSIFSSWADDGDSYIRLAYGIRELEDNNNTPKSSVNVSTIEFGYGFGKFGVFLGGGFSNSELSTPTTEGTGFTGFGGLEYTIYKHDEGFAIGVNVEYGFGKLEYINRNSNNITYTFDYPSTFYSFGAQLTLFKFLFVSYNYGYYNSGNKLSYSDGRPDDVYDDVKGNFTKIGIGVIFDFAY